MYYCTTEKEILNISHNGPLISGSSKKHNTFSRDKAACESTAFSLFKKKKKKKKMLGALHIFWSKRNFLTAILYNYEYEDITLETKLI